MHHLYLTSLRQTWMTHFRLLKRWSSPSVGAHWLWLTSVDLSDISFGSLLKPPPAGEESPAASLKLPGVQMFVDSSPSCLHVDVLTSGMPDSLYQQTTPVRPVCASHWLMRSFPQQQAMKRSIVQSARLWWTMTARMKWNASHVFLRGCRCFCSNSFTVKLSDSELLELISLHSSYLPSCFSEILIVTDQSVCTLSWGRRI